MQIRSGHWQERIIVIVTISRIERKRLGRGSVPNVCVDPSAYFVARGEKFRAKGNNLGAFMEHAAGAIENPQENDFIVFIRNICSMGNMALGNFYIYRGYNLSSQILGFTPKRC